MAKFQEFIHLHCAKQQIRIQNQIEMLEVHIKISSFVNNLVQPYTHTQQSHKIHVCVVLE